MRVYTEWILHQWLSVHLSLFCSVPNLHSIILLHFLRRHVYVAFPMISTFCDVFYVSKYTLCLRGMVACSGHDQSCLLMCDDEVNGVML